MADVWEQYTKKPQEEENWEQYADKSPRAKAIEKSPVIKMTDFLSTLPTAGGINLSPRKDVYKEEIAPAVHGASTAALGIPKAGLEAVSPELAGRVFPEQETARGKALRGVSELAGFGMGGIGKAATGAGRAALRSLPAGVRSRALKGAVAGMAGGATAGALTPSEDFLSPRQRAEQAIVGGVAGGTLGAIGGTAKTGAEKTARWWRRAKKGKAGRAEEQLSKITKKVTEKASEETKKVKDKLTNIKDRFDEIKPLMEKTKEKESRRAARIIQKQAPKMFRKGSREYGRRLDSISNNLSKQGRDIDKSDVTDAINRTRNELKESFVDNENVTKLLTNLESKYAGEGTVTFKKFNNDVKKINKLFSSGAKKGMFSSDDVAAAIFKKNTGDITSKYAPEMKQLNRQYGRMVRDMKDTYTMFKPSEGEGHLDKASKVLKGLTEGKMTGDQRRLIEYLEKGGGLTKGLGKVTSRLHSLGRKTKDINAILNKEKIVSKAEQNKITSELTGRLKRLGLRHDDIKDLLARKKIRQKVMVAAKLGIGISTLATTLYLMFKKSKPSGATYVHQTTPG